MSRVSSASSPSNSNSTGTSSTLVSPPRRIRAQLTATAAKRTKRTQQRKAEAEPQRCADDCRGIDSASGQLCACALGSPSSAETGGSGSGASSGDEGAARAGTQRRGYSASSSSSSSSSSSDERAAPKRRVRARAVVTPFGIARPTSGGGGGSMDAWAAPQPRLFARAASSTRPSFNGASASHSDLSSSDSDAAPSRRRTSNSASADLSLRASHSQQQLPIAPSSSPPLSSSSSGARSAASSRRSIADVFERLMADEAARRTPVRHTLNGVHVATPAPAALRESDEEPRTKRRDDKSRLLSLARSAPPPSASLSAAQATPRVRMAASAQRREGDEEQQTQTQTQTQTPRGAAEYAARLKALRRGRSESPRGVGVGEGEVTPKPSTEARREEMRALQGEREEVGSGERGNGRYEAEEGAQLDSSAQESGSAYETQREADPHADAEVEAESDFEVEMERERLAMEAEQAARPASISPRRQRIGVGAGVAAGKRLSSSFISSSTDATPRAPPPLPQPLLPAGRISPAFAFPAAPASPLPPSSPLFAHWSSNSNGRSNGASFAHGGNDGGSESNSAASSPRRSSHRRSNPNSPTLSVSARAPSHEALERLGRALGANETLLPPERGRREEQGEEEQTQTSSESMRAHRTVRFSPTPSYRESSPVREEWEGVLEEEEEDADADEDEDEQESDELPPLPPSTSQQQLEPSADPLAPSSSSDMPPLRPLAPASSPARVVSRHVFVPSTPSRGAAPATASATATRSTSPPLALGARTAGLSLALASPGTPHPPGFFGVGVGLGGGGAAAASPSVRRLGGSSLRPRRSHDSFSLDALTHESSLSAAELAPLQEASDDEIVTATRGPPRQSTPPLLRASTTQRQPAATAGAGAVVAQEVGEEKDASLHATLEQLLRVLSQRPVALPASAQPSSPPELQLDTSALLATTERLAQLRRDEADAARRRLEAQEKDAEAGAALSETRAKLGSLAEAVRQRPAGAGLDDEALADVVLPPSYVVVSPARSSHLRTTLLILAHLLFLALVVLLAEAGAAHRFHTTYYDPFHPALFPAAPHESSLLSGAEALLEALPARGSRLGGVAAATLQPLLRFLSAPPERAPSFVS